MAKTASLSIRAGRGALAHLYKNGFQQRDVRMMLGASGGPKWFVLSGLDRALLRETFRNRQQPLSLLGSSAGCWRFACYGMNDSLAALERFQEAYIADRYDRKPSSAEVTRSARAMLASFLGSTGIIEILDNPVFHLNFIAVKAHGLMASEFRPLQMAGLLSAALGNVVSRRLLAPLFTRIVFEHDKGRLPLGPLGDLPTRKVALTQENATDAILASGSIPLVLEGVRDIEQAGRGLYLDGGITDYHFDLPLTLDDGLVLYPHFRERPIPGWFDKGLPWRTPNPDNYDRTVIVAPSQSFIEKLPFRKIPDRTDFEKLDTSTRQKYWRKVIDESDRLGDEWLELVEKQRLGEVSKPLL